MAVPENEGGETVQLEPRPALETDGTEHDGLRIKSDK